MAIAAISHLKLIVRVLKDDLSLTGMANHSFHPGVTGAAGRKDVAMSGRASTGTLPPVNKLDLFFAKMAMEGWHPSCEQFGLRGPAK
jgi:hypothetical protein